jgi:uncharacterized SAM-binding protein YcdF (DUF218 family)
VFFLKKIVSPVLFPLPLSLEFLFVGLCLLWFTRKERAGKVLVTFGTLLLVSLSHPLLSNHLLHLLDRRYPPLAAATQVEVTTPQLRFIVVLGGWSNNDPGVSVTSHISSGQMVRLVEGLRLHHAFPGSKLILSGSSGSAEGISQLAQALGASPLELLPLPQPRDTEEEACEIGAMVGPAPFILVTSAAHMPRAMGLFRKLGLKPIAAPTAYLAPEHAFGVNDLFPSAHALAESETAIYEFMGLAWAKLRGKI